MLFLFTETASYTSQLIFNLVTSLSFVLSVISYYASLLNIIFLLISEQVYANKNIWHVMLLLVY
jgi:hypothetical protein